MCVYVCEAGTGVQARGRQRMQGGVCPGPYVGWAPSGAAPGTRLQLNGW
jgi:hypothetical protein